MGQKNLAVLETYLKDIIFTEDEIVNKEKSRERIFEIKDQNACLGFISLYDLKAYVFEHEEEAKNYFVKNIDGTEWKNVFTHPQFQRRRPQIVSDDAVNSEDDLEFYILQKGQKNGPFEKTQLTEMLTDKEILLTDMVSFNGGHTWIKLYQVDGFDRRSFKESAHLPGMPSEAFLQRPTETARPMTEATDAITSLAYLGNLKRGKTLEREQYSTYTDEMTKKAGTTTFYKWLFVASIIGIIYFAFNIKTNLKSPFGPEGTTSVGEQAEMLTPVETDPTTSTNRSPATHSQNNGINDQRRRGKFETRRMPPVRPAYKKSFMETTNFQDSKATTGDDSNYYYDNAAPMELDPVRTQVSKENFDNNGAEPAAAPANETLFNQEVSN